MPGRRTILRSFAAMVGLVLSGCKPRQAAVALYIQSEGDFPACVVGGRRPASLRRGCELFTSGPG